MNKGKFASLILLGAFSAGVASSSAVSAQGDNNLASTVDMSIESHDESADMESKFSDESAAADDKTEIDTKTTDEETQDSSIDDNSDERNDTENLDESIEDETDLTEDSDKENSENGDNLYVNNDKKQNVKKGNSVGMVKTLTVAGVGASAVGGTNFGISRLVGAFGKDDKKDDKKDEPITNPESDDNPNDPKKEEKYDEYSEKKKSVAF